MDLDKGPEGVVRAIILLQDCLRLNSIPMKTGANALINLGISACSALKMPHADLVRWLDAYSKQYLKDNKDESWI